MVDTLSPQHLIMLRDESGISDEVIQARGYRTVTDPKELEVLGFSPTQRRVPGLLLPLWTTDGHNSLYVYRPDNPRVLEEKRKGKRPDGTYPNKVIKYEVPKGMGTRVDCPPACRPMLANPKTPLWITEGQKKADALASHGLCAIALLGVWNWKGKNEFGGITVLADFDHIAWDSRQVRIVFDSDVMNKRQVRQALGRLTEVLQRRMAHVGTVYLAGGSNGKLGVDDWLAEGHTREELEALVEAPRPEPKAAAPFIELLDETPATISRPLALVGGHAYAATWLPVRETRHETQNKRGEIIRHDPPLVELKQSLYIIRDDGAIFSEGHDACVNPLDTMGPAVHLPELPPPHRLWSTRGMKSYRAGQRPNPADVFNRVTDVVDRLIDFNRSLAGQRTMAEMIGCYILATWFLDAFNVIGFLWANGDRGSGKTHLLTVVAELAYLGQVILAGASYASLRDLADYGATLAFDDAENLSDPRRSDPDKRALLLAGNRRGNTVGLKEPTADKSWRTRHVNTFCPRLFSAMRLPDQVLGSRSIVVPLIRTPDRYRANADPLDHETWPHDRCQLIDDLWALGLTHLAELPEYDAYVARAARLTGRNLQPWRAILAVAAWLDARGMGGLWDRMEELAWKYHRDEKPDLETGDLTTLVIRALCKCVEGGVSGVKKEIPKEWIFNTSDIIAMTKQSAEEMGADIDPECITSRRVGRKMGEMRFERVKGTKGVRQWRITLNELERWTASYGISLPDSLSINATNATNAETPPDAIGNADLGEGELMAELREHRGQAVPFLSSRDATRARYPLTLIWPADAELAAINDQWQRLDDGRIQATYNTPDELALCLWPFPAPGPLYRQPAYVQPPLAGSPGSTGQGMENLR